MKQAWGNVHITSLPTNMGNNLMFVWESCVTPDQQWLLGAIQQYDVTKPRTQPAYLALYNIHTRQVQRIHTLLTLQSQVLGASVDDRWIAWSEADDPAFFDWTLFLYDRDTGQATEVASAPKINGQAITGPNTPPVISGGHMIWSESLAPVKPGDATSLQNAVVKVDDLSTGKVTTLARGAAQSTMFWPWAAWGQVTAAGSGFVQFKNLATGQETRLSQQPTTVAIDGVSVAFDDNTSGFLVNDVTKDANNAQPIATSQDIEWMTLNDRIAAWKQDVTEPIVWDRLFNRPVMLPEQNTAPSAEAWVAGNILVWWQSQNVDQQIPPVLQIVDTTTLPATPVSPS